LPNETLEGIAVAKLMVNTYLSQKVKAKYFLWGKLGALVELIAFTTDTIYS
jgi:hypothetical protein